MKRAPFVEKLKETVANNSKIKLLDIDIPLSNNKNNVDMKSILDKKITDEERDSLLLSKERTERLITLAHLSNKERKDYVKKGTKLPKLKKIDPTKTPLYYAIYNNHLGQNGGLVIPYSYTLTVASRSYVIIPLPEKHPKAFFGLGVRHLNAIECERLQSYPKDFTRYGRRENGEVYEFSRHKRGSFIGNGVTAKVSRFVLEKLLGGDIDKEMKLATFCSGCGGTEALFPTNIKKIIACDIGSAQRDSLRYNYEGIEIFDDLTTVEPSKLQDFDFLSAGFPCQPWSKAGQNKGFDDDTGRGTIIFDLIEILKTKKPKYFIFENVQGLLEKKNQESFVLILEKLSSIGYEVNFELLNSKNFGVPQNRSRVFIVGKLAT